MEKYSFPFLIKRNGRFGSLSNHWYFVNLLLIGLSLIICIYFVFVFYVTLARKRKKTELPEKCCKTKNFLALVFDKTIIIVWFWVLYFSRNGFSFMFLCCAKMSLSHAFICLCKLWTIINWSLGLTSGCVLKLFIINLELPICLSRSIDFHMNLFVKLFLGVYG